MEWNEPVRLRNVGTTPWSDAFNGITYRADVGGETITSFDALCLWMGHPDSVDIGPGKTYRTDEFHRLRVKYGVLDVQVEDPTSGHNVKTLEPCCPLTQDQQWERNRPHLEAWTLNGERIITVVDDPEGSEVTPAVSSMAQQEAMQAQLAAMQRQMAELQGQLAQQTRTDAAEANSGPIPDDEAPIQSPPVTNPPTGQIVVPPAADAEVTEDTPTRVRVST